MLESFLDLIVGLIDVGGATFYNASKEGASFFKAFAVALLVAIVFIGLALWAVNEISGRLRAGVMRRPVVRPGSVQRLAAA